MHSMFRNIFLTGGIVGCLYLAWSGLAITRADLLVRDVRQDLTIWEQEEQDDYLESLEQWQTTEQKLTAALALRPLEPEYHRLKGQLYQWRLRAPVTADNTLLLGDDFLSYIRTTQETSLEAYRESLALRPVWAYSWAMLTRAKGQFQQYDEEFANAFLNLLHHGKNVKEIQLEINYQAAMHFDYLLPSPALIIPVIENMERSLAPGSRMMPQNLDLITKTNLLPFACLNIDRAIIAPPAQQACEALDNNG